jgi:hypothetical protein
MDALGLDLAVAKRVDNSDDASSPIAHESLECWESGREEHVKWLKAAEIFVPTVCTGGAYCAPRPERSGT